MSANPVCPLQFTLKVVSRCNLNCTYCYVYNKADSTWRERPRLMPEPIFRATLSRIRRHCLRSGQPAVGLTFHGGEPTLAGPRRFAKWCRAAQEALGDIVQIKFLLQTNGTLIDAAWVDVLREYRVAVGVSVDGPPEIHDHFRIDHQGRGSYDSVERGFTLLRRNSIPFGILSVIQPGADGLRVHRHFVQAGVKSIDYLLPGFTHDSVGPIFDRFGPTPCADFLLPILDDWFERGSISTRIRIFWEIAWLILGGDSQVDCLGNPAFKFVFVESDGAIEGLDILRLCEHGISNTGLNVLNNDFSEIADLSPLHRAAIFDGFPLAGTCVACPEARTCGGGYLPHRYSRERNFDNPSIWCRDLLKLFGRMRELLNVPHVETGLRRRVLLERSNRSDRAPDIAGNTLVQIAGPSQLEGSRV